MKTKLVALFCACVLLLTTVDMFIPRSEAKIFDNVIRLHILATDDSDEAQAVKLLVRDAILEECGYLFEDIDNIDSAKEIVSGNLSKIEAVANRILKENGMDYTATVEFGEEEYPTRVYEEFTLPAGKYISLRVKLGEASGKNWWCILFPPLCIGASSKSIVNTGVSKKDTSVFTEKRYTFRFKLLELFGD